MRLSKPITIPMKGCVRSLADGPPNQGRMEGRGKKLHQVDGSGNIVFAHPLGCCVRAVEEKMPRLR